MLYCNHVCTRAETYFVIVDFFLVFHLYLFVWHFVHSCQYFEHCCCDVMLCSLLLCNLSCCQLWLFMDFSTVTCCYNTIQYSIILHTSLQWLKQNINQFKLTIDTPYLGNWQCYNGSPCISHKTCTHIGCALFCCGYLSSSHEVMGFIHMSMG